MKKFLALAAFLWASCTISFAKPDPIDIEYGPWITNVSETSVTILWTTATDNLGWVELAEDGSSAWRKSDPKKYYQVFAGRWMFGKMHSVTIDGLNKGTTYRYRIYGRKLVDGSEPQDMVFGAEKYTEKVFKFKTFDSSAPECHFSQVNDIHLDLAGYETLANQIDAKSTDFFLLNGDITSAGNYSLDTLVKYDISPLGSYARSIPVVFARGNHEGRGSGWMHSLEIFPTPTPGQFYYTFRHGPVAFIVLDAGETKPVVANTYAGDDVYESYLEEELAWARQAVKAESFAGAPVKVCLIHVPMTGKKNPPTPNTQNWMQEHFIPMLNEAGVDVMINAHIHRYAYYEPGEYGNDFPMICNGNHERLQFDCDGHSIKIRTFGEDGAETHSVQLDL